MFVTNIEQKVTKNFLKANKVTRKRYFSVLKNTRDVTSQQLERCEIAVPLNEGSDRTLCLKLRKKLSIKMEEEL